MYSINHDRSYRLKQPALKRGEVDVWAVRLDKTALYRDHLFELLSLDEKAKANKYLFAKDRDNFVMARGVLRIILSDYIDIAPREIRFSYNCYGKPALNTPSGHKYVNFNVSHSGRIALVAIAIEQEVGVDVESIGEKSSILETAQLFFSPAENTMLSQCPSHLKKDFAFGIWTRKEAVLKAVGLGFAYPPHRLTVSTGGSEPERVEIMTEPGREKSWSIANLTTAEGYRAALAVEGAIIKINRRSWIGSGSCLRLIRDCEQVHYKDGAKTEACVV